jgi:hypothetical protein
MASIRWTGQNMETAVHAIAPMTARVPDSRQKQNAAGVRVIFSRRAQGQIQGMRLLESRGSIRYLPRSHLSATAQTAFPSQLLPATPSSWRLFGYLESCHLLNSRPKREQSLLSSAAADAILRQAQDRLWGARRLDAIRPRFNPRAQNMLVCSRMEKRAVFSTADNSQTPGADKRWQRTR